MAIEQHACSLALLLLRASQDRNAGLTVAAAHAAGRMAVTGT
jgi:hypothetical protein